MGQLSIRVENLSKRYEIGRREKYRTLRDSLTEAATSSVRRISRLFGGGNHAKGSEDNFIWALRGVGLEVRQGETVGLIGSNGAGKSTLLKILSRITEPTSGFAEIGGRVGSLLEVGTGFHNELTGRENIYLNGAILGLKRQEIRDKFDQIVAFAEVEQFIDTPVKRYSSGMYLRLAFAVAAHLEPDVLIVDEVLAVGDARFQRKCLNRMQDVGQQGRTVLFVSHNMAAVTRLCQRVILLEKGRIKDDGPAPQVIGKYISGDQITPAVKDWRDPRDAPGGDVARLRAVRVLSDDGQISDTIDIRCPVRLQMEYEVLTPGKRLMAHFSLFNEEGIEAFSLHDMDPAWYRKPRPVGRFTSTVTIPGNFLAEGQMFVTAGLITIDPTDRQFVARDVVSFHMFDGVEGDSARGDYGGQMTGVVRPLLPWTTEQR
jgi:homopolymeric O-antigen transport system ATP-binding protein